MCLVIKLPDSPPVRSESVAALVRWLRRVLAEHLGIAGESIEMEIGDGE